MLVVATHYTTLYLHLCVLSPSTQVRQANHSAKVILNRGTNVTRSRCACAGGLCNIENACTCLKISRWHRLPPSKSGAGRGISSKLKTLERCRRQSHLRALAHYLCLCSAAAATCWWQIPVGRDWC